MGEQRIVELENVCKAVDVMMDMFAEYGIVHKQRMPQQMADVWANTHLKVRAVLDADSLNI